MTGEKCRHCGGAIEYVEFPDEGNGVWVHQRPGYVALDGHEAAPAFGGGS